MTMTENAADLLYRVRSYETPDRKAGYYHALVWCRNCGAGPNWVEIPVGKPIAETACSVCGCLLLELERRKR